VEPQQLATKVAQLESRVATLEDEGKIVKGEVKQILTEIRSAILVRDNPFDGDGGFARSGTTVSIVQTESQRAPEPARSAPEPAPEPTATATAKQPEAPQQTPEAPAREPIPLRPQQHMQTAPMQFAPAPAPAPQPEQPHWSLLTIAGLAAWAEEAMERIGSLRLEILLDLCEASGHLTPEARVALARVTELDIREPERTPSTNETVTILRQLDALISDDEDNDSARLQRLT
jgi:hypothetical protein